MENPILKLKNFNVYYDDVRVVNNIDINFEKNKITAIMGPSGCGKTTLLRAINRMHDFTPNARVEGEILLDNEDLNQMDAINVRRKIGMVFQRPNPFPTMSIYDNVISGYKLNGIKLKKAEQDEIVENSLTKSALWKEVKDTLHKRGSFLSGGQQQRLCIARTLAMKPEIILLDEPTSALDPIATQFIEELFLDLKKEVTLILVTHNMSQAARISNDTAFLYLGDLVEFGKTKRMFTTPENKRTEEYLIGKIG
ncbi:MAG: phosphate ABC transporter ATP-binding protein PstB [Candidatus Kapabacteria bacterium]|nr:phosphate ABC transporter ATP-binding protein PstB [Candidatus Kapabacteria bacterium]